MNKPTKPNIVIPESFAENGIKTDFDNEKLTNGFDRLQPDILAGDNLNKLIDDTYKGLNYALNLGDYVLGKNQITNCILEAPNGVATYSGTTITVKSGLKVLMPDGRNADGTLKNIEYTLSTDITGTIASSILDYRYVFIDNNGGFRNCRNKDIYYTKERPTRDTTRIQVWFDIENNYWYWASTGSSDWVMIKITPVALFYWDTSTISNFKEIQPINLLKQSDKSEISGLGMPSSKYIDLTLGASGSTYTAPANGWFCLSRETSAGKYIVLANSKTAFRNQVQSVFAGYIECFLPVFKNDVIQINYNTDKSNGMFRFYYAEGEI